MKQTHLTILLIFIVNISTAEWQKLDGPNTGEVTSIAFNGTTLFAVCGETFGSSNSYSSSDLGNTWSHINLNLNADDYVSAFATIGTDVYLGSHGGEVYKTIDNGLTWTLINSPTSSISMIKSFGNTLMIFGGTALYKSIDFGQTWLLITYPTGVTQPKDLEIDASGNYFLASVHGLYFSNDGGINWSRLTNGLTPTYIYSVSINGSRIFAGGGGGIFKSDDDGATWTATSITSGWWPDIMVDAGVIYAGCYGGVIEKSTNNGASWTLLSNGTNGVKFYCFVKAGNTLVAGTSGGIYISTNAGVSWQEKNTGISCAKMEHVSLNGDYLFASVFNIIYSSNDDGATWNNISNGLPIVVDGDNTVIYEIETDGNNVFVGTDGQGLFRSVNQGASWQPINGGVLSSVQIYCIYANGNEIFVGTENGVYYSSNGGSSWSLRNTGITNNQSYYGGLASDGTNIIIGTQGGLFYSNDKGLSWHDISVGLPLVEYTGTAVIDGELFVTGEITSYADTIVYYSRDFGNSWYLSSSSMLRGGLFPHLRDLKPYRGQIFSTGCIIQKTNTDWHATNIDPIEHDYFYSGGATDVCVNSNNVFLTTSGVGFWRRQLSDFEIFFPKLNLNISHVTQGQSILITGSDFKNNASATITIHGPSAFSDVISTTSNSNGTFAYNYTTNSSMPTGNYTVQAKDLISGLTTVVKSFTLNNVSPMDYLSISNPVLSFSIDVNEAGVLEFKDKMVLGAGYPVSSSNRLYSYLIESSSNGGIIWQPETTLTGQALINDWVMKQYSYSFSIPGTTYQFRVTDTYNPAHSVSTPLFTVANANPIGNLQVQLKWDYSYPQTGGPVNGICADGTARIYLDLSKINSGTGLAIAGVSVTLDDGGTNSGYQKLGKVMVASNTTSYSSEANNLTATTATNTTGGLADYYFWYVAPDDFVGNDISDEDYGERFVNANFIVVYANATTETITKRIKIVRPPLMLVHGLGGDPSTWDDFRENLSGFTMNYLTDFKFKTVVPVSIDPASSFANNAFSITGDGTINSMPGVIMQVRSKGYAAVKVDYIGHSMGGSVLRYALDHYYNRFTRTGGASHLQFKNYEAGYVNKIVTLGTPHYGSPFADIINRYVGDIPIWASFTLENWYGLARKPFPFFFIKPVDPSAWFWDYMPTDAVLDLRTRGGVRFHAANVKAHLIAGDIFPGEQVSLPLGLIPQDIIDNVHNAGDNTLEHFVNYLFQAAKVNETDPVLRQAVQNAISNIEPVNDALSFLENLSLAMDAFNYGTFVPESDLIVSVSSQCAGYPPHTVPNVTVVDNFVAHSWPLPNRETNNLEIGNTVMQLLNEPISSNQFDVFPDNSTRQRQTIRPNQPLTSNLFYSIRDTSTLKFSQPIDSSSFLVDTNMTVLVALMDTVGLKTLNVYFQGKTYPINHFMPGYISIDLQVNSNELNWRKLVVEGYYNYSDSAKLVYDERTLNVLTDDTLVGFTATPDLIQLAINQISFADYTAQYLHFSAPIGRIDTRLLLAIDDTNIVTIDQSTGGFKGKSNGQTFAIASFLGLSDTIYFDVAGCVGGLVHISSLATSICQGDTLQLTADNGVQFEWTTGDTVQTILVTMAGEYSLISIDSNGCVASATINIIVNPLPNIGTSVTNVNCYGRSTGVAIATVTSGSAPYNFSWSPIGGSSDTASNLPAGNYNVVVTDSAGCIGTAVVVITQPTVVTATIGASTDENCNGATEGSATVIPGGGAGAYTYNWSPSGGTNITANNLSAGTYLVTVTDSYGCTATASINITEPSAISVITSTTDAACGQANGTATVVASGGTGSYSFSWSPVGGNAATATGLSAGVYFCTITDSNNCATTASVIVGNTSTLNATSNQTNVLCNGDNNGSATVIATGGTLPYIYLWSPSGQTTDAISGLIAGIYYCSVTDSNGCVSIATVTISEPMQLNVIATAVDSVNCNGGSDGSASLLPSGGTAPYSYSWNTNDTTQTVTDLSYGSYSCNISDANGCTATINVDIGEPALLLLTATTINASCGTCCDGEATILTSGGTPGYTYLWSSGGVNQTEIALCPDTFTVIVTDVNFCTSIDTVVISYAVGVIATNVEKDLNVFPNPSNGKFTIQTNSNINNLILIRVINSIGQIVWESQLNTAGGGNSEIDLTGNAKGMYSIQFISGTMICLQKVIIE